jgi:hypothetical protein
MKSPSAGHIVLGLAIIDSIRFLAEQTKRVGSGRQLCCAASGDETARPLGSSHVRQLLARSSHGIRRLEMLHRKLGR